MLLCEPATAAPPPADLEQILPGLRVFRLPVEGSYALKNAGVKLATAPVILMLDADCRPSPNWLRTAVETLRARPDLAGVSGLTRYAGTGFLERTLALLSRAFIDPGRTAETPYLSNNCGALRRELFLRHPLPENMGAFAARLQSEAIRREGGRLWFDETLNVIHEFEGWAMERDIRRNIGWSTVATRLADGRLPYAWLIRLGPAAVPAIWFGKLCDLWADILRCRRHFDIAWFESPAAFGVAFLVSVLEIPGMMAAYRRQPLADTAYL